MIALKGKSFAENDQELSELQDRVRRGESPRIVAPDELLAILHYARVGNAAAHGKT